MSRSLSSALVLVAATAVSGESPAPKNPLVVLSGRFSDVERREFRLCPTEKELHDSWRKHLGRDSKEALESCPRVAFEACVVVVIFDGKGECNCGFERIHLVEDGVKVVVRYVLDGYQTGADDENAFVAGEPSGMGAKSKPDRRERETRN